MDAPSRELEDELKLLEPITESITDPALRDDVARLLTAEILARLSLKQIVLGPYEEPEYDRPEEDMWEALTQPVRSALSALQELRAKVAELAPPSEPQSQEEVDISFDLVDEDPTAPPYDQLGQQVDEWLKQTLDNTEDRRAKLKHRAPEEQRHEIQLAIEPLTTILIGETARFTHRLRNHNIVGKRWPLLAELQEFRGKFLKLLGALRIGLLTPFTDLTEEELLGDYRTEADASIALRLSFTQLYEDVTRLIAAHGTGNPSEKRFALEELLVRLMRFASSAVFSLVRAPDKRSIIEFRRDLAQQLGKDAEDKRAVAELLEGFSKFLEVMRSLNQREVLQRLDKRLVADLRGRLLMIEEVLPLDFEAAMRLFEEARNEARTLYGREPMLDVWLRAEPFMSSREDASLQLAWVKRAVAKSGIT